jgi:hypothetical protein
MSSQEWVDDSSSVGRLDGPTGRRFSAGLGAPGGGEGGHPGGERGASKLVLDSRPRPHVTILFIISSPRWFMNAVTRLHTLFSLDLRFMNAVTRLHTLFLLDLRFKCISHLTATSDSSLSTSGLEGEGCRFRMDIGGVPGTSSDLSGVAPPLPYCLSTLFCNMPCKKISRWSGVSDPPPSARKRI